MEPTYKIEQLATQGWVLLEKTDVNLTKEQASARLNELIRVEGFNPKSLRLVREDEIPIDFPHQPPEGYECKQFHTTLLLLQFGLFTSVGLTTMIIMNVIVSEDSINQRRDAITPLLTPPSAEIR